MNLYPHPFPRPPAVWKACPEEFQVTEIPAYPAAGEGEHLLVEVTRQDMTTSFLIKELSEYLKIPADAVGYAGMKDRCALATQSLSLAGLKEIPAPPSWPNLVNWRILGWHPHKLRRGHLQGNRFKIVVRTEGDSSHIQAVADHLSAHGWANRYGEQRFGRQGDNQARGLLQLQKGRRGQRGDISLNALQSHLFNLYLDERITSGNFAKVWAGDICAHLPEGGMFAVEDCATEQLRLEAFEISPTGPIFGFKMMEPDGEPARWEERILDGQGIAPADFRPLRAPGSRRRFRLPLADERTQFRWSQLAENCFEFNFTLLPGSYATVLLAHFFQAESEPEAQ